jgi:molybdate transport system substrate-binding protein
MAHRRFVSRAAAALALLLTAVSALAAELTVSAAVSLGPALRDVARLFEASRTGVTVRVNLGASGALLQQIAKGAPVDVFVSADEPTMDQAAAQRLIDTASRRTISHNRMVLVLPASAVAAAPRALADLAQPAWQRIAIGQPASVPAGRYARQALEAAGHWSTLEPKLVYAQNVRQALDYVARGEADAGFVYATDVALVSAKVRVAFEVPTPAPIRCPAAAVAAAAEPALARAFVAFLAAPAAQAVFVRHGFAGPH